MEGKTAYLTIDDAPSPFMKEKIEFLKEKGIPAIFFCEGRYIEERTEMVVKAINNGFVIGNHAYNHPNFSQLSVSQAKEEIKKTDELIEEVYEKADKERPAKIFRFPYGDNGGWMDSQLQTFLRELGYTKPNFEGITYGWYEENGLRSRVDWFWTFNCKEYEIEDLDAILERIDEDKPEQMQGLNHPDSMDIILIHDHEESKEIFKSIINHMIDKGIQFELPPLD
jgi:peptidoglycan/xylan/chitin deacetylase (PgdA/CDA1 family)